MMLPLEPSDLASPLPIPLMSTTPPPPADSHHPVLTGREIEWQLATDDVQPVRDWLISQRRFGTLQFEPLATQQLHDTYLDSADWGVLLAGFALRIRQCGAQAEVTLKGLRSARTDYADRREVTETLVPRSTEPAGAPGAVGQWLRSVLGQRSLQALFTAETVRQRFAVYRTGNPNPCAEIALDETTLLGSSASRCETLRRVEIEARYGSPHELEPLVEALRRACGLWQACENKFAAGLRVAALQPPLC